MKKGEADRVVGMAVDLLGIVYASMIPEVAKMLGREMTRDFVAGMVAFSTSMEVEDPVRAKEVYDQLEPKVWDLVNNKEDESGD